MLQPFIYQNTARLIFGQGQIAKLAKEIPESAKILVTFGGGSIKRNGVFDQVCQALEGRSFESMGGIEPNPHFDTCMKFVQKVKSGHFDFLLAVGGGSVIDATKFIACASLFEGDDPWQIVVKRGAPVKKALPLGVVLTLPATGSETNSGGVIMRGEDKLGFATPYTYPRFAILDPAVTCSLPERQTANGIADAFIHVTEQYLTYPVDAKIQDRFSEGILSTLVEDGPKVIKDPNDLSARSNIMLAANMALNGLIGTGVPGDWATHMLGHELTALLGIDHGRTLTIILPALAMIHFEEKKEKLAQMGERVFQITQGTVEERAKKTILAMIDFFRAIKVPVCLHDVDPSIGSDIINKACVALRHHNKLTLGEHHNITPESSEKIYVLALDGPEKLLR